MLSTQLIISKLHLTNCHSKLQFKQKLDIPVLYLRSGDNEGNDADL